MEILELTGSHLDELDEGQKYTGFVKVATDIAGSPIGIPLMIVKGASPGPVLCVDSMIHGDEYDGGEAIREVWESLNPDVLAGTFLGVPVVNVPAFQSGARTGIIDRYYGKGDMNRLFPGRPNGFITERIAWTFFNQILLQADYCLDFHGGGNETMMLPVATYKEIGKPSVIKREVELVKSLGIELLWKGLPEVGNTVTDQALQKGIPAITVEVGGRGMLGQEEVELDTKVIANALKHLNMIEGSPDTVDRWKIIDGGFIYADVGGIFHPRARLGETVKKNQPVAEIRDLFGGNQQTLRAPHDGIVISMRTKPVTQPGDWTVMVAKVIEELT